MYIHECICIYIYIMCIYIYTYIHMYTFIYSKRHTYIYICIYIYVCTYLYPHIRTQTDTRTPTGVPARANIKRGSDQFLSALWLYNQGHDQKLLQAYRPARLPCPRQAFSAGSQVIQTDSSYKYMYIYTYITLQYTSTDFGE